MITATGRSDSLNNAEEPLANKQAFDTSLNNIYLSLSSPVCKYTYGIHAVLYARSIKTRESELVIALL